MFSPAADMQCDFGSYLFTRGGIRENGGMRQNAKERHRAGWGEMENKGRQRIRTAESWEETDAERPGWGVGGGNDGD